MSKIKKNLRRKIFSVCVCFLAVLTPVLSHAQTSCVNPPTGLSVWWSGEGNAYDSLGVNNGTLINGSYTNGVVGQAFSLSGANSYVSIPDSASMDSFSNSITRISAQH
jgi:hypothetical protein